MKFPQLSIGESAQFDGKTIKRIGRTTYSVNGATYHRGELVAMALASKFKLNMVSYGIGV